MFRVLKDLDNRLSRIEAIVNRIEGGSRGGEKAQLAFMIARYFTRTDIKFIAESLQVGEYLINGHSSRYDVAKSLVLLCEQHDCTSELLEHCRKERPRVLWPHC